MIALQEDMAECIKTWDMKSPVSGNDLSPPIAFNLMFPTQVPRIYPNC